VAAQSLCAGQLDTVSGCEGEGRRFVRRHAPDMERPSPAGTVSGSANGAGATSERSPGGVTQTRRPQRLGSCQSPFRLAGPVAGLPTNEPWRRMVRPRPFVKMEHHAPSRPGFRARWRAVG
jgi:hypothetical protein